LEGDKMGITLEEVLKLVEGCEWEIDKRNDILTTYITSKGPYTFSLTYSTGIGPFPSHTDLEVYNHKKDKVAEFNDNGYFGPLKTLFTSIQAGQRKTSQDLHRKEVSAFEEFVKAQR
jgi:hypothetical protein